MEFCTKCFQIASSNQGSLGKPQYKQGNKAWTTACLNNNHFNNCQPQPPHLQPVSSCKLNSATWTRTVTASMAISYLNWKLKMNSLAKFNNPFVDQLSRINNRTNNQRNKWRMNEAKHLVEEKNPKAIQGPVERFFIHLTFPLTTSSLSWVGVRVHTQLKWVCVSARLLASFFLLIFF